MSEAPTERGSKECVRAAGVVVVRVTTTAAAGATTISSICSTILETRSLHLRKPGHSFSDPTQEVAGSVAPDVDFLWPKKGLGHDNNNNNMFVGG